MDTIPGRIRMLVTLPQDIADALAAEVELALLKPSQLVRAWLAERLRGRQREAPRHQRTESRCRLPNS